MRFVEIFTGKIISQSLHCYLVIIFALHKQVYILTVLQVRYVLKPFFLKKPTIWTLTLRRLICLQGCIPMSSFLDQLLESIVQVVALHVGFTFWDSGTGCRWNRGAGQTMWQASWGSDISEYLSENCLKTCSSLEESIFHLSKPFRDILQSLVTYLESNK